MKVIFCSIALIIVGLVAGTGYANQQVPSVPMFSFGPITDIKAAEPDTRDVLRFRRGERYNSPNSTASPLGEDSDARLFIVDTGSYYQNPAPFDQSDAVAVGTVTEGQAFLSNDKRDMYSEFKIAVQAVLQTPADRYIREGTSIDVERRGGAIRLPSGKILTRGAADYSMPTVGRRYLLFLKYNQATEDFHIVTGYQLDGKHTYRLDELDYAQSDRHHDAVIHRLRDQGESEQEFLDRIKALKPARKDGR